MSRDPVATTLVAVVAVAGCGRLAFEARTSDGGTQADDGGNSDTGIAPDACAFGPFGTPANLTQLNTGFDDYSPSLSADGLHLVFESNRPGGSGMYDLYASSRPDVSSPFSPPVELVALDGASNESGPFLSPDGLTIVFTSNTSGAYRIYQATRGTVTDPFGAPVLVAGLENEEARGPELSDDGREIFYGWFSSNLDIYRATRPDPSTPFSPPALVGELNSSANDGFVDVLPGGNEILFESDRSGVVQIYTAARSSPSAAFAPPDPLVELSNSAATGDPELSRDGSTMVFSSTRTPSSGSFDLWIATRSCSGE